MPDAVWYFGYGSNLCRAIFVERRGMRPLAARCARLDGFALRFDIPVGPGERGVANLEPVLDAHVWGVAYLLTTEDCDRLDYTEGVHAGIYRRIAVEVLADGGERLGAFTYCSGRTQPGRKPSPRYIGLLLDGAREHGLPAEYVQVLSSVALARDERVRD